MTIITPIVPSLLIGRAHEVAVLEQQLRRAVSGESQVVLLEGEAGIGKDIVERASNLGLQVFGHS